MTFRFADAVFWLAVTCCAVGHLAILRSIVVTPGPTGDAGAGQRRRILEIVWAIVPAIALVIVLGFTWRAMHHTAHVHLDAAASVASALR